MKPQATFGRDADGCPVAIVMLNNHPTPAIVDRHDFDRISEAFPNASWFINREGKGGLPYVRLFNPARRNLAMVSRLVTDCPPRRRLRYIDGDRLNLRRSNLQVDALYNVSVTATERRRRARAVR